MCERFASNIARANFPLTTTAGQLSEHPELFSILEQVEHHGLTTYRLKKQEGLSNSALVQSLASEVEIP